MNRIRLILAAVIFLLSFNIHPALSQQPAPTGLALEVTYFKGRPPAYQPVPGPDSKPNGAWFGLFGHIPSWQPPAGFLPVQAVNILSRVEGDAVRISVSVFVGARFHEKELPVANYLIRENENVSTDDLKQFGVEPFEIKVSRVSPISTALPQVVNRTESIAVLNIAANNSTLPSYKLQLRNLSNKSIIALGINELVNNRLRKSGTPRGQEGLPLIEAGAIYNHTVSGAYNAQSAPGGYMPDAPPNQEIIITTAVFADGSYEGDAQTAAAMIGFRMGEKIQVQKLIPLIQAALNETGTDVSQAIEKFKARVASLSNEADADSVSALQQAFPSLNQKVKADLKEVIEVSLNGVKFDLLKSLQQFEKAEMQSLNAAAFHDWLGQTKERYEQWLARL
ncbi:MAG: hypothetical protein DMF68_08660 [Acidobacteria bacterium]|nr:MAG: hypothetical protein DMF68_08660 [Acidobacteriota bacterium]